MGACIVVVVIGAIHGLVISFSRIVRKSAHKTWIDHLAHDGGHARAPDAQRVQLGLEGSEQRRCLATCVLHALRRLQCMFHDEVRYAGSPRVRARMPAGYS